MTSTPNKSWSAKDRKRLNRALAGHEVKIEDPCETCDGAGHILSNPIYDAEWGSFYGKPFLIKCSKAPADFRCSSCKGTGHAE